MPVSSSAQLHLLPWLLRWPAPEDRTSFAAGLHAGSAAGIALALRPTAHELRRVLPATVPAALAGAVGQDWVEQRLGRPGTTGALLAAAGAVMWLADRSAANRSVTGTDLHAAGAAQVAALAPGVSRAGATITALRWRGVRREDALRTSLVMSLPVAVGAAALTAVRARTAPPLVPTALGAGAAYVTARHATGTSRLLTGSAVYRLALATAVAVRLRKENR